MARLYILTDEQIKSGNRPKTPRQKQLMWGKVCIVLSTIILIETSILLNMWFNHG